MKCSVLFEQLLINTINKSSVEGISENYEFDSIKEAISNIKLQLRILFDSQFEEDCTLKKIVMTAMLLTELEDKMKLVVEVDKYNIEVNCKM